MKKLFVALAVLASLQIANAQVNKDAEAAKKKIEAAKAATQNEKKAANLGTWLKLGQAYVEAYNVVQGNGYVGANRADLQLIMTGVKPVKSETVKVGEQQMSVDHYETADYYFSGDRLAMIVTTHPAVEDPLGGALEAYVKAAALDVKGKKTKDITEAIGGIHDKLSGDAVNAYSLSDYALSSKLFERAYEASLVEPYAKVDTNAVYNTGLTAWIANDVVRAKAFFEKCLEYKYSGEDGDVYSRLATLAERDGNKDLSLKYLEEGFVLYPKSQSILIGLINYYTSNNGSPERLFELLDVAKANEPKNASLWYVEGNIRLKMDPPQVEKAIEAYDKCTEIDPNYEFGYIGKGVYLYNHAVELQEKASFEPDDAKFNALVEEYEKTLKACIGPFEKAYETTKDTSIKSSIAEYIKNACFRFRTDPEYKAKYEKFDAIVASSK